METAVLAEATTRGISVSDADMIQMKGIYMQNGSLSVKGVVDEYQNQLKKEEQVNAAKSATKATWAIMVECIKNGIIPNSKEIMTELLSDNPKSVEEIMAFMDENERTLQENPFARKTKKNPIIVPESEKIEMPEQKAEEKVEKPDSKDQEEQ
jgi:hypothetical protein